MKQYQKLRIWFWTGLFLSLLWTGTASATFKKGDVAPAFPALESIKKRPLVLIYFFRLDSKPAREGLDHLKALQQQYPKDAIGILAVTQDGANVIEPYLKKNPLPFPVIPNSGKTFNAYQVKVVLPTTYILGPGNRITDLLEGGGPSSARFLATVGQRTLQLNKPGPSRALFEAVRKSNPKDVRAVAGLGYADLKEGRFDRAETTFNEIAQLNSPEAILGKEGLAQTYLEKGEIGKALSTAKEIEEEDPNNGLVHLIRGNVLAGQGDQERALAAFTRAAEGKFSSDDRRAAVYNNAGRILSEQGRYEQAGKMYQEAVTQNPYSAEILSNRAALYEKQGQPQKAIALFRDALAADPNDEIATQLMKRIERHLGAKEDLERQKRVDALVTELADRYKSGKVATLPPADPWTPRPTTVAFLGLKLTEGGLLREGLSDVLQGEIARRLSASGRISIVERETLDKLLAELRLGSSELADPETALKLGKLLSARLVTTGSLVQLPEGVRLSLRLIDPETSAIKFTYADELGTGKNLAAVADEAAQFLEAKIREQYPLKGKIASVEEGDRVIVNLGSRHGIRRGTRLKIVDEGDPIVVDGKTIGRKKKQIGLLEIVEVEEGLSYGTLTERQGTVQKDQKVMEEIGGS
ncbi:MAG: tetratricopeptide repeat protein [Candidatus Manganitrophaceae bacterium]